MSLLFIGHPKETDLALFAGGELGPLARWRIERHLQQCDGCQDAVADFFHLQSEVTELAETPPVDWKALAHNIAVRVQVEAPAVEEKEPRWSAHPRAWQIGLATATLLCTIVVVRQLPMVSDSSKEAASPAVADVRVDQEAVAPEADMASAIPPQESAAVPPAVNSPIAGSQFAQSLDEVASRDNRARESNETAAAEPSESAPAALRNRRDEGFRLESASERRAVPDIEAERPPAAGRVTVQVANLAVSPPPPAFAPSPVPQKEADAEALQDRAVGATSGPGAVAGAALRQTAVVGGDRKTEQAKLAQASRAAAPAQRLLARRAEPEKKTDADSVWNTERGFTVLPAALQDPAVDVGVAADGWISIRAVDANTGTITITDVYVP